MNIGPLTQMVAAWRAEAELLRRRGQTGPADMADSFAVDLEQALHSWETEELTLGQAAEESGYSYSHLQQMHTSGKLATSGNGGRPLVRRCDLPCKANGSRRKGVDLADEVLTAKLTG